MVLEKADSARGDWRCPNTNCYNNSNYPHEFVCGELTKCRKCGCARPARVEVRDVSAEPPEAKRPRMILKGNNAARTDASKAQAKKAAANRGPPATNAEARSEATTTREPPPRPRPPELREAPRGDRDRVEPELREAPRREVERSTRKQPDVADKEETRRPVEDASVGRSEAPPAARLRSRAVVPESGAVAIFDVGGQIFKISASLVRKKKATLLAQLLKEEASNGKDECDVKPIYVDGTPSRFPFILDWYRYDEIHLPASVPLAALLQDARRFQLPDEVVVNGCVRSVRAHDVADKVGRGLMDNIIVRWPKFNDFFETTLSDIEVHYENVGNKSSSKTQEMEEAWDFPSFIISMYGDKGWNDPHNLGSAARARVLALKLEERGYRCEFSETDLVVSLPLKLVSEQAGVSGEDFEEPPEDAMAGDKGAGY